MSDKLLPCPFCGGDAEFNDTSSTWVRCEDCGAETQCQIEKLDAAKLWNRRAVAPDEAVNEGMVAAYQNAKEIAQSSIQGFYHDGHHYVRDMRKPEGSQIIWEVKYITAYDAGHGAMIQAIDRFVAIEAIGAALSASRQAPHPAEGSET